MRLELLVSVLCVVWGSVYSQTVCLHDGFYNGTQCICKPGFSGANCQNRECANYGFLRSSSKTRDYGCICPPGFIGPNCQGTKCVAGESKAFYEDESDKMISLYITYNMDLRNKINSSKDDPVDTICDALGNSKIYQLLVSTGDLDSMNAIKNTNKSDCLKKFNDEVELYCVDDDDKPTDCPGSVNITLSQISDLLKKTTPNSQLFIVTNYPLAQGYKDSDLQAVIKRAVSNRIRINTLTFAAPGVMDYVKYQTDPGYQALRILSESTLGVFVTPYAGTTDSLMGKNTNSDVAKKLLSLWVNGYEAAGVFSTKQAQQPQFLNVGTDEYYIHVRSLGKDDSQFFDWTKKPDGIDTTFDMDTGYWKMWKGSGSTSSISFIMGSSLNETKFVILSKNAATVYTAVTTADNVDASAPFLDIPSGPRTFVGKMADSSLHLSTSSFYPPGMVNYVPAKNNSRSLCQFSTNLGTIQCNAPGVTYFQLRTTAGFGSATPFYCGSSGNGDATKVSADVMDFLELEEESEEVDTVCTDDGSKAKQFLDSNQRRNFVIISRNVREIDNDTSRPTKSSPADNLYLNNGNIFSYMLKLAKEKPNLVFPYFVYNLVDTNQEQNTSYTTDKQVFMDNVVTAALGARDINTNGNTNVSWKSAIKDTVGKLVKPLSQQSTGFSDIFVVIDYADQGEYLANDTDLFTDLYSTRSRLFIILLETYTNFSISYRQELSKVASLTGGALFRLEDYNQLQDFFGTYFTNDGRIGLFQADTVYQLYTMNKNPVIPTDQVYLPSTLSSSPIDYTLLISYEISDLTTVTVTTNDNIPLNANKTYGEVILYSLKDLSSSATSFNITVSGPPMQHINILVLATSKTGAVPSNSIVAFTSSKTTAVDDYVLKFATNQEPVISYSNITSFAIKDPQNAPVYNTSSITQRTCQAFPSFVNYTFQCAHPNDIYYFQTTFTDNSSNTHSRTFMTQCLSPQKGCLNGGTLQVDGTCQCKVGFTGPVCQYPICENGGTRTSANLCACDSAAGYSGFFCEISNNTCTGSPTIPDARSEVTSLIFVVERTGDNYGATITKPDNLPGVQLAVIQYDCQHVYTTQLGTDVSKLPGALNTTAAACEGIGGNAASALLSAFDSQVTDRAVIVFITSGVYEWDDKEKRQILNKLASQRVDLRVFTTTTTDVNDDLNLLAAFGNGVAFVAAPKTFSQYYTNYVAKIFSTQVGNSGRLSVVRSGTGPVEVIIAADPSDSSPTYFIHSDCDLNILGFNQIVTGQGKYSIQTGTLNGNSKITIPSNCLYSIEKLTMIELAFGFQSSGNNEHLQLGMTNGTINELSLYASSSHVGDDLSQMPTISLSTFYANGTFGNTALYLTTKKNDTSCMYRSYSMPITCDDDILGYSAIIHTLPTGSTSRQEQKILTCFNAENDCKNGGSATDGVCNCSPGWEGLQCDIPICTPNGVLRGGVCECSPGFSGPTCSTNDFEITPNASKAFVFIVDSRGADGSLYDMSIKSITNFLSMYDKSHIVFLISNTGQYSGSFVENENTTVQDQIDYLNTLRDNTNERQNFSTVFDNILAVTQYESENPHVTVFSSSSSLNNIFYAGLTGVSLQKTSSFNKLKNYYSVSSLYFAATDPDKMVEVNRKRTTDDEESITVNLGSSPKLVTNVNDALNFMKDQTKDATYTTPTPAPERTYSCVKGSLANIYVSVEVSEVDNMPIYLDTTLGLLKMFPSDFEVSPDVNPDRKFPNGTNDNRGCGVNNHRVDGQSLISGWWYTNNTSNMPSGKGFCLSQSSYGKLLDGLAKAEPNGTPVWDSLMAFFKRELDPCFCSRIEDPNVVNIVLWISVTDGTGANATVFTNSPYLHLVVPFGFQIENGSFYDQLINSNFENKKFGDAIQYGDYIIKADETSKPKDIVQELWTRICRLQGLIGNGVTAAPPTISEEEMYMLERFYAESIEEI